MMPCFPPLTFILATFSVWPGRQVSLVLFFPMLKDLVIYSTHIFLMVFLAQNVLVVICLQPLLPCSHTALISRSMLLAVLLPSAF